MASASGGGARLSGSPGRPRSEVADATNQASYARTARTTQMRRSGRAARARVRRAGASAHARSSSASSSTRMAPSSPTLLPSKVTARSSSPGLMVVVRGWRIGGRMVQGSLRVAAMRRTRIGTAWPSPRTASRHLGRRRRRDPASGAAGSRRRSRYPVERGEAEPREVILFRPEAARELAADSALVTPAVLPVSLGSVVLVTDAGPIQGAFRPCWRCFAGRSRSRRLASAGSWPKPSVTRRRISRGGGQI